MSQIIVKIYTNKGISGIGETHSLWALHEPYGGLAICGLISEMKKFLIGENPTDVNRLCRLMKSKIRAKGAMGAQFSSAWSGVEAALWDTTGKLLNLPAYQLLGTKVHDKVPVYCDCHAGEPWHLAGKKENYTLDAYA